MKTDLYAVVLCHDGRFHPVLPERVEDRAKLLKLKHAKFVAEKLNADEAPTPVDMAGEELAQ